jgi:hypothetical protein
MKMAVLWYVAPHDTVRHFKGTYCLPHSDDGRSKLLWNVTQYLPEYKMLPYIPQDSDLQPNNQSFNFTFYAAA